MKLEQQVCSLSLAKRLKELGVKQESVWCWYDGEDAVFVGLRSERELHDTANIICAALTVAELGNMLPAGTISYFEPYNDWQCKTPKTDKVIRREWSEADARTKMLIYLLENELMLV